MSERIRELVIQIREAAKAVDRDTKLLYTEIKSIDWPAIEAALDVALGEPVCPQFGERFEKVREIVRGINIGRYGQPVGWGNEAEDEFNTQ